jgi:hypothetical protein
VVADQAGGGAVEEVGGRSGRRSPGRGSSRFSGAGLHLVGVRPALVRCPHDQKSYSMSPGYVNVTRREGEH